MYSSLLKVHSLGYKQCMIVINSLFFHKVRVSNILVLSLYNLFYSDCFVIMILLLCDIYLSLYQSITFVYNLATVFYFKMQFSLGLTVKASLQVPMVNVVKAFYYPKSLATFLVRSGARKPY